MRSPLFINIFLLVCLPAVSICLDDFPGWVPDFPSGACYAEGLACEIHNDNLVVSVPAVATVEECRQRCFEDYTCSHFSYFSNDSFPMTNFCFLVSDCPTFHQCEDCITEDRFCFTTCGDNVEGTVGDNIVELKVDVTDEVVCKLHCINNTNCKFYTYHNGSDPSYPEMCFLLTEVKEPMLTCQHCSTGPARCDNKENICGFRDNGSLSEAMMFTDTSTIHQVETINVGMCEVAILGIGGGGKGGIGGKHPEFGGGGGSGHPSFASYFPRRSSKLLLDVGKYGHSSVVTTEDGLSVMVAPAGEDGENGSFDGATGYSGGGGDGYKNVGTGGSNGGDGVTGSDGHSGQGSGVDISEFGMQNFKLSPGAGGVHNCGGGGGGVLINGKGPVPYYDGMGRGYGGGGEGCNYQSLNGAPGAVLLEIKK